MIVPKFWAEAQLKIVINDRNITLKRFGWSDIDESDAQKNAEQRVKEAIARAESGEKVRSIDRKVSYNGAEGLPIREEIIETCKDSVITRNSYGALCINTPDVLFADIDLEMDPSFKFTSIIFVLLVAATAAVAYHFQSWAIFAGLLFASAVMSTTVARWIFNFLNLLTGGSPEKKALNEVRAFSDSHPSWHLRVYRTPAGYRVLVMHRTFKPRDDDALNFLNAVKSDPVYVQMCKNQNCFRARVSPKPWRIGLSRIKPSSGVWPIPQESYNARADWVYSYEKASRSYASCKFVEKMGSDSVDYKARYIQNIHDNYCQADSSYPLA